MRDPNDPDSDGETKPTGKRVVPPPRTPSRIPSVPRPLPGVAEPATPLPITREPSGPAAAAAAREPSGATRTPSPARGVTAPPPVQRSVARPRTPTPVPGPVVPVRPTPPPRPDTAPVELDLVIEAEDYSGSFEELTPIAEPPAPPALAPEARAIIATCESELGTDPQPLRAARLHYEIARAYEGAPGFSDLASTHYGKSLEGAPDYVPAIRGARRMAISRGELDAVLGLFDAEEKLTGSAKRKALLLYQKGRFVEDRRLDPEAARALYQRALDLDPMNSSILKALEQCDRRAPAPDALLDTLERAANAVAGDARHRAALLVERAQLLERRSQPTGAKASEMYEAALRLDAHALGALPALERIYRASGDWRDLATTLEREARNATDPARRALALFRVAKIHAERLGNRAEAIAALVKAQAAVGGDRLVLEDLARGYEQSEEFAPLSEALATLIALTDDRREKVALLHRLGQVFEGPLEAPEHAIERYREALALDPTYMPVLQALGRLYAAHGKWGELVEMHLAEAAATQVPARAATAHARVAEILEVQLRDPAQAVTHHARALTLVPGHAASFKALARLYAQLDRHRDLVELLERAVGETPLASLKIAYLMKIGSVWEDSLGDPVQALHAFRRVLAIDDKNLVAIHAIQRAAERAGRHAELVEALAREATLVDDRALQVSIHHRIGTVHDDHLHDQDAALAAFRKALELDPAHVPALASVGRIYYRAGRWKDLLDVYEREVKVTEGADAAQLLHKMGELCEDKLGDMPAAVAWYCRALDVDPGYRPAIRALVRRTRETRDWEAHVRALELDVGAQTDPTARAIAWYRAGQVHDEWLDNPDKAIDAYQKAIEQSPGYRPARVALARLWGAKGEWMKLIETLAQEAANTDDTEYAASMLMRQATIYRDELADPGLATLCLEAVLDHELGLIPALLALEPLYEKAGSSEKLAKVYAQLGSKLADPGARIAALRELARVQANQKVGTIRERAATYQSILAIERDDEPALLALEEIGRAARNDHLLVDVYRRLGEIADAPGVAASYLSELGQSLERTGDRRALEAYREAVKQDAALLTAIRGLARVGDLTNQPRSMAQAARLEAELTRRPEIAAKLFVRSGILRREQMNDLGAVEDFERALEVWPDDTQAAERLSQSLLETGQVARLIDILSKTATSAKSADRRTTLWLEVGALYARKLDNLGAGITAFKRALEATPGHIGALSKLAEAYEKNRQWGDAVATLEQLLALTSDEAARADAHLTLATIFDERLNNLERANKSVEAVLRHDPKHAGALLKLVDLQVRAGNEAEGIKTTQRLVDLADNPAAKGAALVRVARIQRTRGDTAGADSALGEALGLEGPGGDAQKELLAAIEGRSAGKAPRGDDKAGSWQSYATGLTTYVKRMRGDRDPATVAKVVAAYQELARTYADRMRLAPRAIEVLREGVDATDRNPQLVLALARRQRDAGQLEDAAQQLKLAAAGDVLLGDAWRELGAVLDQLGRRDDAARATAVLPLIDADPVAPRHTPHPASASEGSFDATVMATIAVDNALAVPAAHLLGSIAEAIGKLYPPSLEQYGLSTRDRLGPRSAGSVYDLATRLTKIFGTELEIYEHAGPEPMVAIEPFEVPALVVSQAVRRLPQTQQVFLLAYAIAPAAARLHTALGLRAGELEIALAGATRIVSPSFTLDPATSADDLDEAREVIRRSVNRKWRRAMEVAAGELATSPPGDLARWQAAINATAIRAALLVTDDLAASIDALRVITELPEIKGAALVQRSEIVRDLIKFWTSSAANAARVRAGI